MITDIADTFIGLATSVTKYKVSDGVLLLHNSDIKEGKIELKSIEYVDKDFVDKNSSKILHTDDVITVHTGDVGTSAVITSEYDGTIGFTTITSRVKSKEVISPSFLCKVLNSNICKDAISAKTISDRNNLNLSSFDELIIPLPPLAIQNRIVEILDHFTNLTANLTAELALRRKQFEHFREKLLALDGVEGVEMKKLGEVCEKVSKIKWGNIPQEDEFVYVDLTSVDIKSHSISTDYIITAENAPSRAQQIIKSDDILFATTRPTQMRYCIIPDNLNQQICSTGYCVIRANKNRALHRWILYLVSANEFSIFVNEHQQGAGYPSISDRVLFTFEIPLPPLAVQQSIVAKLDKFTALIQNIENELALRQKQYEYCREKLLSFPSPSL